VSTGKLFEKGLVLFFLLLVCDGLVVDVSKAFRIEMASKSSSVLMLELQSPVLPFIDKFNSLDHLEHTADPSIVLIVI